MLGERAGERLLVGSCRFLQALVCRERAMRE